MGAYDLQLTLAPSPSAFSRERWSWLAKTMPQDAEAGGGLMVAIIQLSIALGSIVGGVLFDMSGYASAFTVSAVVLVGAAFLAFLASRAVDRGR